MNKVLLIVSNEKHRAELKKILVHNGFDISISLSSPNTIELISTYDPDLIILDGNLLETFGERIKREFPLKVLIGWMNERDARLAVNLISLGACDCLCPPIRYYEVLSVIKHVLNMTVAKISPLPLPEKNSHLKLKISAAALLLTLLGVLIFYFIPNLNSSSEKTFLLTYQNPTGIYWIKNRLWTSDWYTQNIYEYKLGDNLKLIRTYTFTEFNLNTLAVIDDVFWIGGSDGYIRTYQIINNNPAMINKFKTPGFSPSAICAQGEYLWTTDAETNKIYQHLFKNPTQVIATYAYPGIMPVGLHWDGQNFWSADGKANNIYKHSGPERNFEIKETFNIVPDTKGVIAGLSGSDKNLWLIFTGQPSKVIRYPKKKLR